MLTEFNPVEIEFRGLLVTSEWRYKAAPAHFFLFVVATCGLVVSARFLFGDWATAWNAGGFVLSLLTLLAMREKFNRV